MGRPSTPTGHRARDRRAARAYPRGRRTPTGTADGGGAELREHGGIDGEWIGLDILGAIRREHAPPSQETQDVGADRRQQAGHVAIGRRWSGMEARGAVRHGTAPSRWSSIAEWNGDADRSSACAGVPRETRTALLERRHAGRTDDVHVGGPARKERVFRAAALRARGGGVDRGSTLGQERSPQVRPRRAGSRHECHAPTTYRPAMTTGRPRRADHARRLRRTRGRHLHRARFPTVAVAPTTGLGPDPESNRDTTKKAVRLPTKL